MRATVRKWGNSAAVRIPSAILQAIGLEIDEEVDVHEEAGRIVIEPAKKKSFDLGELVREITPENRHDAVDFGTAVGNEAW